MMKIYAVGGSIRDKLLGRTVKDKDFVVVGATPEQMLDAGFEKVGADFPVFLHPETREEYALARKERKTGKGYHGFETTFDTSVTLEDDLLRRDLTINAMAEDEEGSLIDPYNGLQDLRGGILRHVSEAFAEDPVRVLRVARFRARYNFTVAPETIGLMKKLVKDGELDHLVPERVWLELEKAVMEEHPSLFFWALDDCGAKEVLFPEFGRSLLAAGFGLSKAALRNVPLLHQRLMLLFCQIPTEKSEALLTRYKAPSDVLRLVKKFRLMLLAIEKTSVRAGELGSWNINSQSLLDLLKELDSFRRPDDIFEISAAIGFIGSERAIRRMDKLLEAFRESRKVSFATLTEKQKETLKGPAIGKAIDKARLKRIKSVL